MKPPRLVYLFFLGTIVCLLAAAPIWGQTSVMVANLSTQCDSLLGRTFHPDGQEALLQVNYEEKRVIPLLFYANMTYRIAFSCSPSGNRIDFQLHDSDRNLIFDSRTCHYPLWWDFRFASTTSCRLTVHLVAEHEASTQPLYLMCRLGYYHDDQSN